MKLTASRLKYAVLGAVVGGLLTCTFGLTVLDPVGIYGSEMGARQCMQAVRIAAYKYLNFGDGSLPNCLRMPFHDAATYKNATQIGGANASIMAELETGVSVYSAHDGLQICHALLLTLVPLIRAESCPKLTYADTIAVLGAAAAEMAGGQPIAMLMGRPDNLTTLDPIDGFPDECSDANEQLTFWEETGISKPLLATVVLSGAHSIGNVRASVNSTCAPSLQGPMTDDPYKFDGHYYNEIANSTLYGNTSLMFSDYVLANTTVTQQLATFFRANRTAWIQEFIPLYQEMTLLGVSTKEANYTVTDGWYDGCGLSSHYIQPWPAAGPDVA